MRGSQARIAIPRAMTAGAHRVATSEKPMAASGVPRNLLSSWRIEKPPFNGYTEETMGRGLLLWLLGVPIPIIILIMLLWH